MQHVPVIPAPKKLKRKIIVRSSPDWAIQQGSQNNIKQNKKNSKSNKDISFFIEIIWPTCM